MSHHLQLKVQSLKTSIWTNLAIFGALEIALAGYRLFVCIFTRRIHLCI